MNAVRWAFRAWFTGAALLAGGIALGGALSLLHLVGGLVVSALVMFIGGLAWSGERVGPAAGFAATLLLGVGGAVGGAFEGRKFVVATQGTIVPLESVTQWPAGDGAWLLQASPLSYVESAASTLRVRSDRSNSNLGVARHGTSEVTAIPLVEDRTGQVVAFDCLNAEDPDEYHGDGGGYLLSLAAWKLVDESECGAAASIAAENAEAGGHAVAPGANARWLRAYSSEKSLRTAHNLDTVNHLPLKMLVLYCAGVLLFCRAGAASMGTNQTGST